jgi:hypothetical protein
MAAEVSGDWKSGREFREVFAKKALQGYAGGDCIALQSAAKLGLLLVQLAPRHE